MKISNLTKFVGAGALAASIAVFPSHLPASAQTDTAPDTTTIPRTEVDDDAYENDFDWGWLGLLGLAGLAGLAGRKRHDDTVRYRDVDEVGSTTSRR